MYEYRNTLIGALLFLVAVGIVITGFRRIDDIASTHPLPGALMSERSAERLTAAACIEAKVDLKSCLAQNAPIASYAEYRRCGGYVENVTAGPSQLACSESWVLDGYLRSSGEGSSFYREFRRACRTHDFCYNHATATTDPKYGAEPARKRCDDVLLADVVRDCRLLYPLQNEQNLRALCMRQASMVYSGVRLGGADHFAMVKPPVCDFEPGPHAPRDHILSGRFIPGQAERIASLVEEPDQGGVTIELRALDETGGSSLAADPVLLKPSEVGVADREEACTLKDFLDAGTCQAPSTLSDAGFASADWLRFAPIVIDSDGDGLDEILLVSLARRAGLVFTHVRFETVSDGEPAVARVVPRIAAYVALDAKSGKTGMRAKEFGVRNTGDPLLLASERAAQMLSHQLVVAQRSPPGCEPLPDAGPEDLLLLGARAEPAGNRDDDDWEDENIEAIKRRMYRFSFDAVNSRWHMLRDSYSSDNHKMSQCAGPKQTIGQKNRQHQLFRQQYPAFATRVPVKCDGQTVMRDSLSVLSREKCPSSTSRAEAGDLNDVDLMSYGPNLTYTGDDQKPDPDSELGLTRVSWLPLVWSEAADPILTSRPARRSGVLMASVYAGGTKNVDGADSDKSRFLLVSVMPSDERTAKSVKSAWRQRLPDTTGLPPRQIAILKSDRSNNDAPYWPRDKFGDPSIFLQLPSILAPFWIDGTEGLSLMLFADRAAFDQEQKTGRRTEETVKKGTLQVIIVPLVRGKGAPLETGPSGPLGEPRWIECTVPELASSEVSPARDGAARADDFLYHEPVLPGRYFEGDLGGLAISYRTQTGRIAFTSLRPFGRFWRLGDQTCRTMSRKIEKGPEPERDIWMMHLN